jgi:hypothetical protein
LIQRGDLDIEIEVGEVEVRREAPDGVAMTVPLDVESGGLVLPRDLVEVEKLCELALAVVCEMNALMR